MKTINNNDVSSDQGRLYKSPKVNVVVVRVQGILCGSEIIGDANTTEMEEGSGNW